MTIGGTRATLAARTGGGAQAPAADPQLNHGSKTAYLQPARITLSKDWEVVSAPGPKTAEIFGAAAKPQLKAKALQAAGAGPSASAAAGAGTSAAAGGAPSSDFRLKNTVTVKPIPEETLNKAYEIIKGLTDGKLELQDAAGTYSVQTGADKGVLRHLPSMVVGFTPKEGVTFEDIDEAGREISRLLRQESVLTEFDGGADARTLVGTVTLERGLPEDAAAKVIKGLSDRFGGTTRVAPDKVAVILDTSGNEGKQNERFAELQNVTTAIGGVAGIEPKIVQSAFSPGVRIADPSHSKENFLERVRAEQEPIIRDAVAQLAARNPEKWDAVKQNVQVDGKLNKLKDRASYAFDDTWQRLFGNDLRPAERNYIMIDQKSRHLDKDQTAPMHWSARAVVLNDDRTAIENLWTSELVLNIHSGTFLPTDQLVGRQENPKGSAEPFTYFPSGTALVKDAGLNSESYAALGTYVVPVKDADVAIAAMKQAEADSTGSLIRYHTEVPNCLSYALGLLQLAQPTDERQNAALDQVFEAQSALDLSMAQADAAEVLGAVRDRTGFDVPGTSAAEVRAARVPDPAQGIRGQYPSMDTGGAFTAGIPGLQTGDSTYPQTLGFLAAIADQTLSGPSNAEVETAYRNKKGTEYFKAGHSAADARAYAAALRPTRAELAAYRDTVMAQFNTGLTAHASAPLMADRAPPAPDENRWAYPPKLSDLHEQPPVYGLAREPRATSAPPQLDRQGMRPALRDPSSAGSGRG
ncbi:MAG: hypothetical protein MUE98_00865 [Rhodobacteraceae bacterium]|jgi:hypothetical protein|nr:hypothetical protein [Paracoccaceae bacterium]